MATVNVAVVEQVTVSLRAAEGLTLFPYNDMGDISIGYGHNLTRRGISKATAEQWLAEDIQSVIADVEAKLPWVVSLPPVAQQVIVEMAYQLGIGGLLQFKQTLNALQNKQWSAAAEFMNDSLWARQTPNRAKHLVGMLIALN